MKTRCGFVSNSSSSSFIVALKDWMTCPHCGHSPMFATLVESLVGRSVTYADDSHARTGEEVVTQLLEDIAGCEEEIAEDPEGGNKEAKAELARHWQTLKEIRVLQQDGWMIYKLRVSYADTWIGHLLEEQEQKGLLKKIDCW